MVDRITDAEGDFCVFEGWGSHWLDSRLLGKLRIGIGADRVVEDTVKGECHDAIYFLSMFTGRYSKMGQVVEQRIVELFWSWRQDDGMKISKYRGIIN
jgi:hypothetical protein